MTIREAVDADIPYDQGTNKHWLGAVFERRLQYDGYYGWVKGQYQGLQVSHTHANQLAAGSATQVWRRDAYGHVVKEGLPTGSSGDPSEHVLQARDAWGRATQAQLGNGLRVGAESDSATGQLVSLCVGAAPGQCGALDRGYAYDGWGNLVQQTQGTPLAMESFGYDKLHRLTSSQRNGALAVTLGYHGNGNLKYKSDYSQATDGAYGYGAKPHAVTSVQGADGVQRCFAYDGAGNQVSQRRIAGSSCPSATAVERLLTYEIGHRPETVTGGMMYGWQRLLFRYDGNGDRYLQRRQSHEVPRQDHQITLYPFPGYEVEVERIGDTWRPVAGRQRLGDWGMWTGTASQGQLVYWHGDRLGSPAAKSNSAGTVLERHGFDAWGAGRNGSWQPNADGRLNSAVSPRGFTGHEHLDEVGGLIHMNGRGYDPRLGRFLSVDPIIQFPSNSQSLNPYSYLMNNPLSGTDPTGYCSEPIPGSRIRNFDKCKVEEDAGGSSEMPGMGTGGPASSGSDSSGITISNNHTGSGQRSLATNINEGASRTLLSGGTPAGDRDYVTIDGIEPDNKDEFDENGMRISVYDAPLEIVRPSRQQRYDELRRNIGNRDGRLILWYVAENGPIGGAAGYGVASVIGYGMRGYAAWRTAQGAVSELSFTRSQLQHAFKHSRDFGVTGNANSKTLSEFSSVIQSHVNAVGTRAIRGTYRGNSVTHYVDPLTGLNVIRDSSGNFLSGWRLSSQQLQHVLTTGKLGGG